MTFGPESAKAGEIIARRPCQTASTEPASPDFEMALQNLIDAVSHHVDEEETKVLPGMRSNLTDERREQLGEAFVASRKQHLGDQPGDMTRDQLAQQAANADISGTSGLSKDKLEKKVQSQADV